MSYCFMNYVRGEEGAAPKPDCPEGTRLVLLADLPELGWGIFDVDPRDGIPGLPVGAGLATLIESAKRYPPSIALARREVRQSFGDERPTPDVFAPAFERALEEYLARQHESGYVMTKALKDEPGLLAAGEWYWVLEVAGTPPRLTWVSADYGLHEADITDFDLTGQQLKHLGYVG